MNNSVAHEYEIGDVVVLTEEVKPVRFMHKITEIVSRETQRSSGYPFVVRMTRTDGTNWDYYGGLPVYMYEIRPATDAEKLEYKLTL